jgi:hypothetical protein
LRLDGGNVPTSAISMGSQFLRLANLTTRISAGTAGQVYYNTDTNKLDLYNGSSWVPVGSGITQLNAGNGITLSNNPITTFGTVSVDQSYNFNWTGTHTYSQPITFSASQTFDASKLTIAYEVQGDILHFNGTNWARLPLGTPNQVLSVSNCGGDVEWHSLVAGPGIAISYNAGNLTFSTLAASGISGISYLNNLTDSTQYFATGISGSGFNIVSSGSTHTFNIPIAGIAATGLVSTLDQSFAGNKTFTNNLLVSSSTASTNTSIGALTVTGGVGVGQTINLDGSLNFWNGSYYTGFKSGATASTTYILPPTTPATGTSVLSSDTIGNLSWVPMTATGGGTGSSTIGTPTDSTYTDGFFNTWTNNTLISNAFDDVNELLALIAPAKPNEMTGLGLTTFSTPTYYSARIAGGLGTEWYQAGYGTGDLISAKYFVTGTHTLGTGNTATTFYAGTLVTSTYGTLSFSASNYLTGSGTTVNQIDMIANYTPGYSSGNLVLSALNVYNSIWTKANARITTYTPSNAGYTGLFISHSTNSQVSSTYTMWYDPWSSGKSPSFSQSATASTYSQSDKWLSGISYYASGTGFSVYFKGAAGIYSSCYNRLQTYRIAATALIDATGLPASPPLFTDELDKSGSNHVRVSLSVANQSSFNKYLRVTIYKAHDTTAISDATIAKAINTYGIISTDTYEGFQDEARRLVIGSGIAFTSTLEMANGNAQVRSGTLQYPLAADYDTQWGGTHTFSGDQEYQRYFYKTSASTGTLTFTGFNPSLYLAPYGTGSVNILLFLEGDALWFDLGVLQGSNSNNGSTRSLAISARTSVSSTTVGWSVGTKTTGVAGAGNSARYRAVIIFRNNTYSMTSITSS